LIIVRVTPEDEAKAREITYRYDDKDFSLTDATSFAVMERLGIRAAFTFDRDFRQYGLDVPTA
jgi:predicted nucleic acid-binding protein